MNLKKPQIRLVIAADHPVFRTGLRRLLEAEPNHKVIGEASDGAEGVRLTRQLKPDILLLDLAMPKHPGLEALRELNTPGNATTVRVILLTAPIEKGQIVEVLQLRAQGIVLKDSPTQVLLKAIQTVMAGGYWLDREIMHSKHEEPPQRKFGLTPRELEILWDVYGGHSNQEIAEHFGISEDAVKHHLSNIFNKSGVASGLEIFIERSSFWRAVRRMTEAIDPVHGIYTVFAISVLMFVLFVLATVKYDHWR